MFILKLADISIKINNKYNYLEKLCKDYIVEESDFEFEVTVTEEDIDSEQSKSDLEFSRGYLESLCCYRQISLKITEYNSYLMHAAVIEVDNNGYAFLARSGTGKTTHTRLWKELLGEKMQYVNGDKPLIRIINNIPYAYGTPWSGKEGYNKNTKVKLKALCFIERGLQNSIIELPKKEILPKIIHQILIPTDEIQAIKTFDLLNKTINKTNIYLLKCNMDIEAAVVAYNKMSK